MAGKRSIAVKLAQPSSVGFIFSFRMKHEVMEHDL